MKAKRQQLDDLYWRQCPKKLKDSVNLESCAFDLSKRCRRLKTCRKKSGDMVNADSIRFTRHVPFFHFPKAADWSRVPFSGVDWSDSPSPGSDGWKIPANSTCRASSWAFLMISGVSISDTASSCSRESSPSHETLPAYAGLSIPFSSLTPA